MSLEKLTSDEIEEIIKSLEVEKNKIISEQSTKNADGTLDFDIAKILFGCISAYTMASVELSRESFIKQEYWNDHINNFKYDLLKKIDGND